jgi:hypothetical protein
MAAFLMSLEGFTGGESWIGNSSLTLETELISAEPSL